MKLSKNVSVCATTATTVAMLLSYSAMAAIPTAPYLDFQGTMFSSAGDGSYDYATASNWAQQTNASPAVPNSHVPGSTAVADRTSINGNQSVTLNTDVSGNRNFDSNVALGINCDYNFQLQTSPAAGAALTIASGGNLNLNGNNFHVGLGATFNVIGNGTANSAQASVGAIQLGVGGNGESGLAASIVNIGNGGTLTGTSGSISVGNNGGAATVNLWSGGSITGAANATLTLGADTNVSQANGTTNLLAQTGGALSIDREIYVGLKAPGTYNLSGSTSTVTVRDNGRGLYVGAGQFNMSGGTADVKNLRVGDNNGVSGASTPAGVATFTGGTFGSSTTGTSTGFVGNSGGTGTGKLVVSGSGATIGFYRGNGGSSFQTFSNATLNFQVGTTGVSEIIANNANTGDNRNDIRLLGILDMDLLTGFTPTANQVFDLLTTNVNFTGLDSSGNSTVQGIYNGLTLAADDIANWKILTVGAHTANTLSVQYIGAVPEPTMLSLLALAPLALRRRRSA